MQQHGLDPRKAVHRNLSPTRLYEESFARDDGRLVHMGALSTITAPHTGRSPNDRFVVRDELTESVVDWGAVNVPMTPEHFDSLRADIVEHLNDSDLFVHDARAGSDETHGLNIRVISESPWHALFAYNMFLRLSPEEQEGFEPQFTVLHAPHFHADPARHGSNSETAIVVNFAAREVLVAGSRYAGEIKKSIFSVLNHLLPGAGVLPMHCSANVGTAGDVSLFFGLSGTGKTTLSADASRGLIGDDEHGWSDDGVFNFEGGCYAKTINLSADAEPEIYATTSKFGTVIENMIYDPETFELDFEDDSLTANMRCAYPLEYISNASSTALGGHPKNIIMLPCDAFGVLPPIARLTPAQAMYHFLSGFTSKVAGTERGITEPQPTFSTCFGAPFMPLRPEMYGNLLRDKIAKHGATCWLVNTGWTGGAYGTGHRMLIKATRALLTAALDGSLSKVKFRKDPNFGFDVPVDAPGVPEVLLDPRRTWGNPEAYDAQAAKLVEMFAQNFEQYLPHIDEDVKAAALG